MRCIPLAVFLLPLLFLTLHTVTANWRHLNGYWQWITPGPNLKMRTECTWRGKAPLCALESACIGEEMQHDTSEAEDRADRAKGFTAGVCTLGFRRKCCVQIEPNKGFREPERKCRVHGRFPHCTTEECRADEKETDRMFHRCRTPGSYRIICCLKKYLS